MAQNIEEFRNSIPVGDLGIIPLQSCSELGNMVNEYIVDWRKERESVLHQDDRVKDSYIVNTKCSRFGSGEAAQSLILSEAKIYICLLMSPIIQLNILSAVT